MICIRASTLLRSSVRNPSVRLRQKHFRSILTRNSSTATNSKLAGRLSSLYGKNTATRVAVTAVILASFSLGTAVALTETEEPAVITPSITVLEVQEGVTPDELRAHNSLETGIWMALNGVVYDLTDFVSKHPGGAAIIEAYAGKDASIPFNGIHPPTFLEKFLEPENYLGPLLGEMEKAADIFDTVDPERQSYIENKPDISQIFNVSDFEYIAHKIMAPTAWNYYSTGSNDEMSLRENHNAYSRIFFKPRVLMEVTDADISREMLGKRANAPFYCSAAAMAKLGHPDGELSIARGCGKENVIQMIANQASYPFNDIAGQIEGQIQWSQIIPLVKSQAILDIDAAMKKNIAAIFLTVDCPVLPKRERDLKHRATVNGNDSTFRNLSAAIKDTQLAPISWDDVLNYKNLSNAPVGLKGVQSVDDIVKAAENGFKAVVISNHGGRQLDFSRAPIEILADAMPLLREKGLDSKIEIYVDGGIRRGSDILKAIALGARGVGLGRPFLYANACYGEEGVRKLIQILQDEMKRDMILIGVKNLDELGPQHLDLRNLYSRAPPVDTAYYRNYIAPIPPKFSDDE